MSETWLIGDTHLRHDKIIRDDFEGKYRPFQTIEEHDEALIERWNKTVGPRDIVWHLGDVAFSKEGLALVGRMNGIKNLVLGNHDQFDMYEYMKYFAHIVGAIKMHKYILTHVPIHPSQFYRFKGNIHGHLHSEKLDDPRYICVSAEHTGLAPILFEEAINPRFFECN
jgi:calcineurin-like phosphoesterase family protein